MLGSVERMAAVLIEHYGGKWPFWLSPRQALVVPVTDNINDYAQEVGKAIHDAGYHVDVDDSDSTMQKKVRNGQLAQYNFILVVGAKEAEEKMVNVRLRNNQVEGTMSVPDLISRFDRYAAEYSPDF